ncbi:MAG: helix-turn-helix transcriptional regulator [Lachnospiraceae bacterium]|nr:helix-turn-helix transcriptional regulator [Lachnospiraceae bacterium]
MTFGEKIQKLRKEAGLSQEELSYQLGVSRQAISKWERDSGYPETEKIVRMSKIFHVTLDYLLNEEEAKKPENNPDEKGIYVSREMAEGFLFYQKRKLQKIGIAVGLFVGGLSFSYWDAEISMILFMVFVILGTILLFSVKLADNPYRRIWSESLSFDKVVKSELTSVYADKKKAAHMINLLGIGLIAIGLLLCPLIAPAEMHVLDDMILAGGMILAGIGAFLCIYVSGIVRAYRLLIRNEEYHEKRK